MRRAPKAHARGDERRFPAHPPRMARFWTPELPHMRAALAHLARKTCWGGWIFGLASGHFSLERSTSLSKTSACMHARAKKALFSYSECQQNNARRRATTCRLALGQGPGWGSGRVPGGWVAQPPPTALGASTTLSPLAATTCQPPAWGAPRARASPSRSHRARVARATVFVGAEPRRPLAKADVSLP